MPDLRSLISRLKRGDDAQRELKLEEQMRELEKALEGMRRFCVEGQAKPHKPIMLLAVLDLFEEGSLRENRIPYDPRLIQRFSKYFRSVQEAGDWSQASLPYFHLRTDGFWKHQPLSGREREYAKLKKPGGGSQRILENIDYAYLNDNAFAVFSNPQRRREVREFILGTFFSAKQREKLRGAMLEAAAGIEKDSGETFSGSDPMTDRVERSRAADPSLTTADYAGKHMMAVLEADHVLPPPRERDSASNCSLCHPEGTGPEEAKEVVGPEAGGVAETTAPTAPIARPEETNTSGLTSVQLQKTDAPAEAAPLQEQLVHLRLSDSIDYLPLTVRARNALMRNGDILTIGDLVERTEREIRAIRNVGRQTVAEIQIVIERLRAAGLELEPEPGPSSVNHTTGRELAAFAAYDAVRPTGHLLVAQWPPRGWKLSDALARFDGLSDIFQRAGLLKVDDLLTKPVCHCARIPGVAAQDWEKVFALFKSTYRHSLQRLPHPPATAAGPGEVKDLGLSDRTLNILFRNGVRSCRQLACVTFADVISISQFGPSAFVELLDGLRGAADRLDAAFRIEKDDRDWLQEECPRSIRRRLLACGIGKLAELRQLTVEDLVLECSLGYSDAQDIARALVAAGTPLSSVWPKHPLMHSADYHYLRRVGVPLDRISVSRLALPIELEKQLRSLGIGTLDVLAKQSEAALKVALSAPSAERVDLLDENLREYCEWLPKQTAWDDEVNGIGLSPVHFKSLRRTTLADLVEGILQRALTVQHRRVIRLRFGLDGGGPRTLQEVGEQLNLTRERVRQLEVKALNKLKHPANSVDVHLLQAALENEMNARGGLLSLEQIEEYVGTLMDTGEIDLRGAVLLLLTFAPGPIVEIHRNRCWGIKVASRERVVLTGRELFRILKQVHAPLCLEDLEARLSETNWRARCWGDDELPPRFIEACLASDERFEPRQGDQWGLTVWQKHCTDELVLALRQLGKPAHYTEIARVANEALPPNQQVSSHNVHACLGRLPDIFVWVNRGTFGLAEWGLKRARYQVDIAEELLQQRAQPLTADEIFAAIQAERPEAFIESVKFMLSTNLRFQGYPQGMFGLASWSERNKENGTKDEISSSDDEFLDDLKRKVSLRILGQDQEDHSVELGG